MNLMINYHDHWWYKALTWLLIVAIIIMISIGAAPPARAIGVLTATMAAAILAVLAGAGIYTVVSGMTSAEIQSWLNDKLNEWDTSRNDGNVFSDLIQNNLITATIRGTLGIGAAAASGISDFITWLQSNLSISNNSSVVIQSSGVSIGGYDVFTLPYTILGDQNRRIVISVSSLSDVYSYARTDGNNTGYFVFITEDTSAQISFNFTGPSNGSLDLYGPYNISGTNYYKYLITNGGMSSPWLTGLASNYKHYLLDPSTMFQNGGTVVTSGEFSLTSDVINIPDTTGDKEIGLEVGAFPGATTEEVTDVILDGVLDNTLDVDMVVTDELVDAQEVYIINEQPLSVNTDHHAFGFQLPDITFDFSTIWHYVTDAVTYASGFISWWVNFFTSVPILTIPLYCAFTLLVVLGAMRRFLL